MKGLLSLVLVLAPVGLAQDDDAPGKGVARLSLIAGDVSIKRGDTSEWVAAAMNGPLLAGDAVLSGAGSRAEVQFDWANLVRLSTDTEVRMGELEDNRFQIQLARGTIMFVVARDSDADVDIATPSVSVRPMKKGMYRVTVRDDADGLLTEISVRSGEVEIYSPQGSQRLKSGRTMLVRGATNDPEFRSVPDIPDDDWDRWNDDRNKELLRSTSYNYVDRGISGAEALDGYGQWTNVAPYGNVWTPTVAVGWAPYRYGRWTWVNYYGWTWLSYDPWGWAPYHYGRWFWNSNRWCWWPGGGGVRPYWRPALVGWVGWGSSGWRGGVGIGIGGGSGWGHVGWVPLAPHEPFYPWYGARRGRVNYVNNTTIVNNVNVSNIYRNARINNGVTVVQGDRFGRGSVQNVGITGDRLSRADVARGALPVVPDRQSTHWSDRGVRADSIRSASGNSQFYSRYRGASPQQASFDDQRRGAEQVFRSAFGSRGPSAAGQDAQPNPPGFEGRRIGQSGEGWRRIGESRGTASGGNFQAPNQPDSGRGNSGFGRSGNGWQRFGEPRETERRSDAQAAPQRADGDGWRRVGGGRSGSPSAESFAAPNGRGGGDNTDSSTGRGTRGWDRFGSVPNGNFGRSNRGFDRGRGGDSSNGLSVNPPIVRERSDGGSFGRMPRTDSPRFSSPRMDSSGMSGGPRNGGGFDGSRGGSFDRGGFRMGGGGSGPRGGSGGGGMMSAPRMQSTPSGGGAARGGGSARGGHRGR